MEELARLACEAKYRTPMAGRRWRCPRELGGGPPSSCDGGQQGASALVRSYVNRRVRGEGRGGGEGGGRHCPEVCRCGERHNTGQGWGRKVAVDEHAGNWVAWCS
jgi:hypothetical protein